MRRGYRAWTARLDGCRRRSHPRLPWVHARPRPWLMLAVGVFAQAATSVVQSTPAFLIPLLHERARALARRGGTARRRAERRRAAHARAVGCGDRPLGRARACSSPGCCSPRPPWLGALSRSGYVALGIAFVVAGMGVGLASSASGRVVIGWFPPERRGLAMGIRQMSQPLGVAVAAHRRCRRSSHPVTSTPALVFGGVFVADHGGRRARCSSSIPRGRRGRPTPRAGQRIRTAATSTLARIHLVSALLVVPQYVLSTFGLVWLIADQGWDRRSRPGSLVAVVAVPRRRRAHRGREC